MSFFLKRLLHRMSDLRMWALLVLAPAIIYIAYKAVSHDFFYIYQDLSIASGAPVALTTSPTDFEPVSRFVKNQDDFFLDTYTLKALVNQLNPGLLLDQKNIQAVPSIQNIKECMSLQCPANNTTRVSFMGKDKELGQMLVDFYAKRLVKKAEEGVKRSDAAAPATMKKQAQSDISAIGNIVIHEQNAFWRQDRLVPVILLIVAGCIVFLGLIALMELFDSSFKSERQVAAYLQLPLLGTMPNLHKISQYISGKSSK